MKHNRLKATATKDKHQMEGTGVAITKKSPKTSGFKHTKTGDDFMFHSKQVEPGGFLRFFTETGSS